MTKEELLSQHAGDRVGFGYRDHTGYCVVARDAGPPEWIGGGRMVDVALYVRRDTGGPSTDFGAGSLVRVAPLDEWERASADEELRYFARRVNGRGYYCWTGRYLPREGAREGG